jgi:hypothetical protein
MLTRKEFYVRGIKNISDCKTSEVKESIPPTYGVILCFAITLVYLQHELYSSHSLRFR